MDRFRNPLAGVFLYYWLFKRFELKRRTRDEKRAIYRKFLQIVDGNIGTVHDYQTIVKLKLDNSSDLTQLRKFFMQIITLTSVYASRAATNILKDSVSLFVDDPERKIIPLKDLAELKSRLILELGHSLILQAELVETCVNELEELELPDSLGDELDKVLELYDERTSNIGYDIMAEYLGIPSETEDKALWTKEWNDALEHLREEVKKDLESL